MPSCILVCLVDSHLESSIAYCEKDLTQEKLTQSADCTFCFARLLWVVHFGGFWAYRFLDEMSHLGRGVFVAAMSASTAVYFHLGRWWNRVFWEGEEFLESKL